MKLHGKNAIVLLTFLTNIKNIFDSCGACKGKIVRVLSYLLSNGTEELCEAYTANEMSFDAHPYH